MILKQGWLCLLIHIKFESTPRTNHYLAMFLAQRSKGAVDGVQTHTWQACTDTGSNVRVIINGWFRTVQAI